MQLALRQAYGLWGHLGDYGDGSDPAYDALVNASGSGEGGYEGGGLPTGTVDYSSGETGVDTTTLNFGGGYVGTTTPGAGYATVKPVQGSTGIDAAALAKALAAGTLIVSRLNPATGKAACPSGYQYPNGSCLPSAVASKPILAGIPNQTLAILGIAFVAALMLMGGGGRRR